MDFDGYRSILMDITPTRLCIEVVDVSCFSPCVINLSRNKNICFRSGAGENTLRRLALFVYLDHPTKNDVTSGKKASGAGKSNFNMA